MKKLLVVDDNHEIANAVKLFFDAQGYETIIANDGQEGIKKAKKGISLIILDLMMPEMDGWEVYERIRSDKTTADIPIIFLTALRKEKGAIVKPFEKIVKGNKNKKSFIKVSLRNTGYIQKPFDMHELRKEIENMLKKK